MEGRGESGLSCRAIGPNFTHLIGNHIGGTLKRHQPRTFSGALVSPRGMGSRDFCFTTAAGGRPGKVLFI